MFKVGNLKDIISVIIPIFVEYPLYTAKFLDFKNFNLIKRSHAVVCV